jgi:hypothetical protein
MKQVPLHEIAENFMDFMKIVQNGEDIVITGDMEREKIAIIQSYRKYSRKSERVLAPLKGKAEYRIGEDFRISDEELLSS